MKEEKENLFGSRRDKKGPLSNAASVNYATERDNHPGRLKMLEEPPPVILRSRSRIFPSERASIAIQRTASASRVTFFPPIFLSLISRSPLPAVKFIYLAISSDSLVTEASERLRVSRASRGNGGRRSRCVYCRGVDEPEEREKELKRLVRIAGVEPPATIRRGR